MHVRRTVPALLLLVLTACGGSDVAVPDSPSAAVTAAPSAAARGVDAATGVVRDPSGAPVVGVLVSAVSLDTPPQPVPELAVSTDATGAYAWPAVLRPGRYELRVSTPAGSASAPLVVSAAPVVVDLQVRGG